MVITVDDLRARHARLLQTREEERQAFERKDIGYAYVLGELELMIKELEQAAARAEDTAAAVAAFDELAALDTPEEEQPHE